MIRKYSTLILFSVFTFVLIGFVWYMIQKDTLETQVARLDNISKSFEININLVLASQEVAAGLVFENFQHDNVIKTLLSEMQNADSLNFKALEKRLINYIDPLFENIKKSGISSLDFNLNNKNHQFIPKETPDSLCVYNNPNINLTSSFTTPTSYSEGFTSCKDFTGYRYIFPFGINNSQLCALEIGFDFQSIKNKLQNTKEGHIIGFIYNPYDSLNYKNEELKSHFQSTKYLHNWLIDPKIVLPKELTESPKRCKQLKEKAMEISNNPLLNNFSLYLNILNEPSSISFSQIQSLNKKGDSYLISINKDLLLTKVKELNFAILIMNIIIILFAMIGISYLYINRISILHRTKKILKSEEELKALNSSKDKFFSIIAHDLKNPFNGIMGMSDYLNLDFDNVSDEEKKEIINDINISSKNAFNLLQNLLEWTRTQSGMIKNNPVIIVPNQIIDLSIETVITLAKNKEIEIVKTFLTEEHGYADENLVATVIRNLCTNAVKFSPRNSIIELVVKKHDKELIFCVKDKGIGLKSDEIDKLFNIQYNFHRKGTEMETGTGLGLKLCKEFVEYCSGRIWVLSEKGKGSDFFFTIPLLTYIDLNKKA